MFLILGYAALVAYAAGLFIWAVTHGREGAAVGILLSISGLQLAVMETVNVGIGAAIAVAGLLVVARDIAIGLRHNVQLAPVTNHRAIERFEESA